MTFLEQKKLPLLGLGLAQIFAYLWLCFYSFQTSLNYGLIPYFLLSLSGVFALYFCSLYFLRQTPPSDSSLLIYILVFGFIFRLICFFMPPVLSDDIFYYIWHGRVSAAGLNPYHFNPSSVELTFLRDFQIWQPLPFKDIPPAYPPLVMSTFWLSYWIGGSSLLGFKLLLWVPEILVCFYGIKLLQLHGKSSIWILVYAWCPLPILEYIGMAHSDVWGIAFLCAFLYYFSRDKIPQAFIFLALATLVKWIPLLFIPLLWRYMNWRKRGMACLVFCLTLTLLYLPFLSAGKNVFGLLPTYLKSWEFNGSIYRLIRFGLERADISHAVVSGLIALWSLLVAIRKPPLMKGLLAITFFFFLFFHTVYPWYLGWLLPFLLIEKLWAAYAWLYTCLLSYFILLSYRTLGIWQESSWVIGLEYTPVFLLLAIQWILQKDSSVIFFKKN